MKVTSYKAGTPCWVDLGTPDQAATAAFYGRLFGWEAVESPPEAGGYLVCNLDGAPVAGIGGLIGEGQPSVWTSYFASDDLDETAVKVEAMGGKVLVPPMDVMDSGRMGLFFDPSSTHFGVWQSRGFFGAGIVNEPGALAWNELMTRDVVGAKEFYGAALGLASKPSEVSGDLPYTEFTIDGKTVGGMMSMEGPQWPADLPSHWMVYFAVTDCDTTVAKLVELGGSVSVPPMDMAVGRMAIVADQHGAFFSLIQMVPPTD